MARLHESPNSHVSPETAAHGGQRSCGARAAAAGRVRSPRGGTRSCITTGAVRPRGRLTRADHARKAGCPMRTRSSVPSPCSRPSSSQSTQNTQSVRVRPEPRITRGSEIAAAGTNVHAFHARAARAAQNRAEARRRPLEIQIGCSLAAARRCARSHTRTCRACQIARAARSGTARRRLRNAATRGTPSALCDRPRTKTGRPADAGDV